MRIGELAPLRCWTAWQVEPHEKTGKPTKMPYRSTRSRAQSSNPATWLTLEEAEIVFAGLPKPLPGGGLGLWLGDSLGGAGMSLGGLDLDSCIGAEGLAPWAQAVLDRMPTYREVSPSGGGVKLFFAYRTADLEAFRSALELGAEGTGRKWSGGGSKDHPPGIEAYLTKRYFALTRDQLHGPEEIETIEAAALASAIEAGKALLPDYREMAKDLGTIRDGGVERNASDRFASEASVMDAIARSDRLARLWRGDYSDLPAGDRSRSTVAFNMAAVMKGYGIAEMDIHAAFAAHPVIGGWIAEKAQIGTREWDRAMDRSGAIVPPEAGLGGLPSVAGLSSQDPRPKKDAPKEAQLPIVEGLSSADPKPEGAEFPKPLPRHAESMIAERLVEAQDGNMRYIAERGQWLIWCGTVWQRDTILEAARRVEAMCREVAMSSDLKLASGILSAKTIRAVETLARANVKVACEASMWDADPWLLNTPGGTIDLRTGVLRAARREDLSTRQTTVTPDFTGECPMWRAFLRTVTGSDQDLESYLARVAGYCLTGITSEHALFFLHGTGRNGKGTFSHTLRKMLGTYAVAAESQTFAASRGEQHSTELARLDGARLVVTSETEEGRAWNESRVKQLTGGDPVTARFMRQDNFTFMPQFKLLMLGNHKPKLKTVDEAMRARINMLPFTVFVPPGERQKDLDDKMLAAEGGAILAWAVRGCMAWQNDGLCPPASVLAATDAYAEAQDSRTAWLNESCEDMRAEQNGARFKAGLGELFASWRAWAEKANENPGSRVSFDDWISNCGFCADANASRQKTYVGIRLLTHGLTRVEGTVVSSDGFAAPRNENSVVQFPTGDRPKPK